VSLLVQSRYRDIFSFHPADLSLLMVEIRVYRHRPYLVTSLVDLSRTMIADITESRDFEGDVIEIDSIFVRSNPRFSLQKKAGI
jgi:hypothetical protein